MPRIDINTLPESVMQLIKAASTEPLDFTEGGRVIATLTMLRTPEGQERRELTRAREILTDCRGNVVKATVALRAEFSLGLKEARDLVQLAARDA
jgi:ribosomal protein L7/L12